jgi:hypothetical protein
MELKRKLLSSTSATKEIVDVHQDPGDVFAVGLKLDTHRKVLGRKRKFRVTENRMLGRIFAPNARSTGTVERIA